MIPIAILGACSSSNKHDDGAPLPPPAHDAHGSVSPSPAPPVPAMPKVHLSSPQGDVAVEVEIVSTPAQIERGLMFREHLPPDHGMLFLMSKESDWTFWMHNTLIPLDLMFITRDLKVAGIVENAEPRTDTLRQVNLPSLYVLEVNGGFSAAHKITAGTKVQFDGVPAGKTPPSQ
jgi:uncharacterized membrane protein (UPF0127 family)